MVRFVRSVLSSGIRPSPFNPRCPCVCLFAVIDAVVVGVHVLHSSAEKLKKCSQRLVIFTDAAERYNDDKLGPIIDGIKGSNIEVQFV